VTGNSTMHTLASYYFIFLVPLLYSVFNVYFQKFLFGFDLSGSWMERALMISPYTGILKGNGYFTGREIAFYCVTIVVMTAAAAFLYVRRRLERAGDPLTFEFVKPVISYVAAFLGMTMLGFYFLLLQDSELYMYAGFVAGSILFFIIGTMIVEKSPRVFNRKGYRNFLIYSVVAVLFVLGLRFDVAGFENRVPQASQVEWAQMDMPYSRLMYDGVFRENILRDPENITAVTAFHQSVVDDKIRLKRNTFYGETSSFYIAYSGLGRFVKSRYYSVDYDFYKDSPYLKAIFESKECKDNLSFLHPDVEKYVTLYFYSDRMEHKEYGFEAPVIEDPATVREVVGLLEKDFRAMTYEEFISREPAVVNIEMQFIYSNAARRPMARGNGGYRGFGVPETFINTLEWLQINGYLD